MGMGATVLGHGPPDKPPYEPLSLRIPGGFRWDSPGFRVLHSTYDGHAVAGTVYEEEQFTANTLAIIAQAITGLSSGCLACGPSISRSYARVYCMHAYAMDQSEQVRFACCSTR